MIGIAERGRPARLYASGVGEPGDKFDPRSQRRLVTHAESNILRDQRGDRRVPACSKPATPTRKSVVRFGELMPTTCASPAWLSMQGVQARRAPSPGTLRPRPGHRGTRLGSAPAERGLHDPVRHRAAYRRRVAAASSGVQASLMPIAPAPRAAARVPRGRGP